MGKKKKKNACPWIESTHCPYVKEDPQIFCPWIHIPDLEIPNWCTKKNLKKQINNAEKTKVNNR
jgi:hypothetical protein